MIWTVAKKELRGYFGSAIAVIFLVAFLGFTLYTFFWRERFFARGVADLRPLFVWLPRLLIIVVSALAMRLWSDEKKAGTLEVLLTLPIPRWKLVVGKFVSGMLLIAIALAMTLGLPLTIAQIGHLDWGPVFGGYLAALLLAAAYLSIGMCVSAATDNQIVAFLGTAVVCVLLYAVGDWFGGVGRFVGMGARFDSVARGVIDVRDLAYYASVVVVGLAVNVVLLERVSWGRSWKRRGGVLVALALVIANAALLDAWLAPVRRARVDLSNEGIASLSSVSKDRLAALDEPLLIRAYLSKDTHPKLERLIPQLEDLLEEYRVAGGGKVRIEIVDPGDDADARAEAEERFGIQSERLGFETTTTAAVVDAYFAIAIDYGGRTAVVKLDDLVQERRVGGEQEVSLKNPEYEITKAIKKVSAQFATVDQLFASMPGTIEVTAAMAPKLLPPAMKDAPKVLEAVTAKLAAKSGGKLVYKVEPPTSPAEERELAKHGGAVVLVQTGARYQVMELPQNLEESAVEAKLVDAIRKTAPGFTRVVALWQPPPGNSRREPAAQTFDAVREELEKVYEVRPAALAAPIDAEVDALLLCGPVDLTADEARNVDQFVMRGGSLVVLDGRYRRDVNEGLVAERVMSGLDALFAAWGIHVGDDLVLDPVSDSLPVPVETKRGDGRTVTRTLELPYPFFVRADASQLSGTSTITQGLPGVVMQLASPVWAKPIVGDDVHDIDVLVESSDRAWLALTPKLMPDMNLWPDTGFPGPDALPADKRGAQILGVAVSGGFRSTVAGGKGKSLDHSPPDARVVVIGSSAFASDEMREIGQAVGSKLTPSNVALVVGAVNWALADTELTPIRGRDASAHALVTAAPDAWRWINIAIAVGLLAVLFAVVWVRRMRVRPIC